VEANQTKHDRHVCVSCMRPLSES